MRDEFNEYAPDPTSQKSVTDWLMKVISTKPTDMHAGDAVAEAPRNGAGAHKAEVVHGSVAVAEMPHDEEPPTIIETRSQTVEMRGQSVFDEISEDDLCGPLVTRPPAPPKDEISEDDLCGPLMSKPVAVAMPEIARESTIHVVERPAEYGVTAADISRESVLNAADFKSPDFNRAAEAAAAAQHDVTAADITRDSVLQSVVPVYEPEVQAAPAPAPVVAQSPVVVEPPVEVPVPQYVAPEPPVAEPEDDVFGFGPAPVVAVPQPAPVVDSFAAAAQFVEEPPVQAAEIAAVEQPSVPEYSPMPQDAETKAGLAALEALLADADASGTPEPAESVFAHAGIWGETARPAVAETEDVFEEPKQRRIAGERSESERSREIEASRPEGMDRAAWKTLLRLGSVLPWITRALPGAQGGEAGEETGLTQHVRHEVAGIRLLQHEIRTTVQDHSLQLKRMEEQLTRVRVHVESEGLENASLINSVKGGMKMLRMIGIGVGALLLVLILMVSLVLAHGH